MKTYLNYVRKTKLATYQLFQLNEIFKQRPGERERDNVGLVPLANMYPKKKNIPHPPKKKKHQASLNNKYPTIKLVFFVCFHFSYSHKAQT